MRHFPPAKAVVFDAYGTLFDVHSAVAAHAGAVGPEAGRLSEIWRAKQLEYTWVLSLAGLHRSFRALTEHALDYALARCPQVDRAVRPKLLEAYRALDAYPETAEVLGRLRREGLATAILSNGDPDMLAEAVAAAGLDGFFDAVLSVAAAGVYKTSPRTYALVPAALGVAGRGDLRLLEPLGRRRRRRLRLRPDLGQPRRPARRVPWPQSLRGRGQPAGRSR